MPDQKRLHFILRLNLALAFLEGLAVLWAFLKEPSELQSAVLFGFSFFRLALIATALSSSVAFLILFLRSFRASWQDRSRTFWTWVENQKWVSWVLLLWIAATYVLLFLSKQQLGSLASYRERLLPILLWLTAVAVQFGFVRLYQRGINSGMFHDYRGILLPSLAIFVPFALVLLILKLTGIGLTPDRVYWQGPGVPIQLHQVLVAAFAGIVFGWLIERTRPGRSTRLDWIVCLGLWGFASLLWLNQSADLTWFSMEPTAPNYQSYPFADALLYDNVGREYLIGKPIPSDFWAKPFYSFFLTILHVFAKGNYTFLISLQVIVLAVIPAFAYLLMVRLGSRPAGIILALLFILRERNSLMLSNVIQVSHVKLLLSDVFVMGLMVLLLWLFFHWLEKPGERRVTPLVFGGVFSLIVLTRGHPILLLPLLLGAVLLVPFPHPRVRWEAFALVFFGFMLPFVPWFWRNYQLTGKLAFQYPVSPYSAQMSSAYSFEPSAFDQNNLPPKYAGESDIQYYNRLQGQAVQFALEHPSHVAKFISAHYFHNLLFSYIYLPYSFQIEDVKEYVRTGPFWSNWRGELPLQGWLLLVINISMVALGFGYLWKKYKYIAFVPLALGMGYNLSVSMGRLSGWRFILPADWITLIYYAVGLIQFYHLLRALISRETSVIPQQEETPDAIHPLKRSPLITSALIFLVISIALTKGQVLFSQRYPAKSVLQLQEDYNKAANAIPLSIPGADLDNFLKTDGAVIVYGQALNPYFLPADKEGWDSPWPVFYFWPSYRPRSFPRLIFNLSGPQSAGIVLPMESLPSSFPDGANVTVIGCLAKSGEINALAVLRQDDAPVHYLSEPFPALACPFPMP